MTKGTVALAAALVVTVAAPAAAEVDLGGSLESKVTWSENVGYDEEGNAEVPEGFSQESKLNLEMNISSEQNDVKAALELNPWDDIDGEYAITVDKVYVESVGAFWNGGPSLYARVGDLAVDYSEYVAYNEERGASLGGVMVGPVRLGGFVSWTDAESEETTQSQGLRAQANIDGVELDGTVVQSGLGEDAELAFAMRGAVAPMPGLGLSAVYADDGNERDLVRIDGEMLAAEDVTVTARYQQVDNGFEAAHTRMEDEDGNETWVAEHDGSKGVKLGVATVEQGYELGADTFINLESDGMSRGDSHFTVGKGFDVEGAVIDGSYKLTVGGNDNELTHELGAEATLTAIPELRGLGFEANVKAAPAETTYNAHATYEAPNGFELGAHYDSEDNRGAWVDAGITVKF